MKTILKAVAVIAAVALGTAAAPTKSYAGDREWATAGKVLTGIAAVGLIASLASQPAHCAPPPPRCEPPRQWIPGHYEIQRDRVCIPPHWETIVEPAQYEWVRHGHRWEYVLVKPECIRRVWVREQIEWREARVWVPAHYEVGVLAYNR